MRATPRHCSLRSIFVAAVLASGCGTARAPDASAPAPTESRSRPPDFELPKLGGGTVRLSDHLGKNVVLLDFWATFCEPCLTSLPNLERLYQKHRADGLVILGITIDGPDSISQVRAEVMKLGLTFPILLDQETRAMALYNPKTSAPYSVLIGRDGRILRRREGYTSGEGSPVDGDVQGALARR